MIKLFPHHFIPYYVWVGPEGKVMAFTSSEMITPGNILDAIKQMDGLKNMKKE